MNNTFEKNERNNELCKISDLIFIASSHVVGNLKYDKSTLCYNDN